MVLPGTGNTISFNQIRIEILVPNQVGFSLGLAADGYYNALQNCQSPFPDGVDPDRMSEWWNYDHSKSGSLFAEGKSGTSCFNLCNGSVECNTAIYQFGSTYYANSDKCAAGTLANTYFMAPTSCFGGTFSGQTCYQFSNGAIVSETPCTLCLPNGDPCIIGGGGTECCSGCCNQFGYCAAVCD